ncbi:hypothetical protein VX159_09770 [Dechloromonas sp. ZY10]|uniref:hypothetical protein n=1 Tax=Dechloromonas aquae TaxID=2664436 RepID=UPI003529A8D3
MKFRIFLWLTVAALLSRSVLAGAASAAAAAVTPLVVIESESFEAVGRLGDEGLVWWIDRADTNAPVLGATLEVERAGKTAKALFRPEHGDYLIADREWLQPLRAVGHHPLALTLIAGEDSDLLAGELQVENAAAAASTVEFELTGGLATGFWMLGGLLLGILGLRWGRQRILRQRRGGAA